MSDNGPAEDGAQQSGQGQPGQQSGDAGAGPRQRAGPRGQAPVQQESITDIFSKPTTQDQLKTAVVLYVAVGVGIGLSVFMLMDSLSGGGAGSFGAIIGFAGVISAAVVGPALGGPVGLHVTNALKDEEETNMIFATAGVGAFAGHVLMLILASLIIFSQVSGGGGGGGGGGDLGQVFVPIIVGGIGAGIAAVASSYATLTFTGDRQPQPQMRQPAQRGAPAEQSEQNDPEN